MIKIDLNFSSKHYVLKLRYCNWDFYFLIRRGKKRQGRSKAVSYIVERVTSRREKEKCAIFLSVRYKTTWKDFP